MSFFRSAQLKSYAVESALVKMAESHRAQKSSARETVFLSHSHKDKDHVEAARMLLEAHGASIYVDWQDGEMPDETSPATALHIKGKIRECSRFIILASERARASQWVPWELGYADAVKSLERVAILPFIASGYSWTGTEYVGLYSTVQPANGGEVGVFPAGSTSGMRLSDWLKQD